MTESVNIHQRMQAVMKAVHGVAKNAHNPQGNYKYAGHEQVTAALRDEYVRFGIVRTASVESYSREHGTVSMLVLVRWASVDAPADCVEVRMLGECPPVTKSGVPTGQQAGIALSYAVKMAELKAFALTGDTTPDNEDNDRTNEQAEDFLRQFEECTTVQEIEALSLEVRGAGQAVSSYRKELLKARADAMGRVSK
jgi:hypothetical protein